MYCDPFSICLSAWLSKSHFNNAYALKFELEYKCLNMQVYVRKISSKESKVDSRTHFGVDNALTRDMTFL